MAANQWFRPLHRRVLTMAACVALLVFELFQQEPLWLVIAVAINAYAAWDFFLSGDYDGPSDGS